MDALRRLSILFNIVCLGLFSLALYTPPDDWKFALGWNGQTASPKIIGHVLNIWGTQVPLFLCASELCSLVLSFLPKAESISAVSRTLEGYAYTQSFLKDVSC